MSGLTPLPVPVSLTPFLSQYGNQHISPPLLCSPLQQRVPRPDLQPLAQGYHDRMSDRLQRVLDVQKQRRESLAAGKSDLDKYVQDYEQCVAKYSLLCRFQPLPAPAEDPQLVQAQTYIREQGESLVEEENGVDRLEAAEEGEIKLLQEALAAP